MRPRGHRSFEGFRPWAGTQHAAQMVLASRERIVRAANVMLDAFFGAAEGNVYLADEAA